MKSYFDSIVVGAGVAGMTAAIYLKRAEISCLLLEHDAPGGQIVKTSIIENYPGFVEIDGASLAMKMFEQISHLAIDYQYGKVLSIHKEKEFYKIITETKEYTCRNLVLATGRIPRTLGIENEEKFIGRGISFCATCDGAFYKNKVVAVVGGGNSALEEAVYLSQICKKVYLLNRSDSLRGDVVLQNRLDRDNIETLYNSVIDTLITEDNHITGVRLKDGKNISLDGIFVFIGQVPNTECFKDLNLELQNDYVVVDKKMRTSLPHVYACGDIIKKDYYQIATAIGEGTIAALTLKNENL